MNADLSLLLRFRHAFRNVYGFVLEADGLADLERRCPRIVEEFQAQTEAFLSWMTGAD